jgi:hypothetical protein
VPTMAAATPTSTSRQTNVTRNIEPLLKPKD